MYLHVLIFIRIHSYYFSEDHQRLRPYNLYTVRYVVSQEANI